LFGVQKALEPYKLRKAEPVARGVGAAAGDSSFILNSPAFQDLKLRVKKVR